MNESIALTLKEQTEKKNELLSKLMEMSTEITFKLPQGKGDDEIHELVSLLFVGTRIKDVEVYAEEYTLNHSKIVKVRFYD